MKPSAQTLIIILLACLMAFAGWFVSTRQTPAPNNQINAWAVLENVAWQSIDGTIKPWRTPTADQVLINYWASWCPSCIEEMPMLSQANQDLIPVLSIAQDAPAAAKDFVTQHPVSFDVWVEPPSQTSTDLLLGNRTNALPYTLLVHRDGRVLASHSGELSRTELEAMVDAASTP